MKDCLKKYSMKIMQLGIKNKLLFHPAKLNNILDINLNKIIVDDRLNNDNLGIYYIKYNNNIFYLVIDNVKGYLKKLMVIIIELLFLIMKNMKKYLKVYEIK